jgi:hypothetical protein
MAKKAAKRKQRDHADDVDERELRLQAAGRVAFGDIAEAPPVLHVRPKQVHKKQVPISASSKPEQSSSFSDEDAFDVEAEEEEQHERKKQKRKAPISLHRKQQLEIQRREAVRLYRLQKAMQRNEQ